jgi:5-formyltetrahydrofolate cyclo-ligase
VEKAQFRRQYRDLREELSPGCAAAASEALCRQLARWSLLRNATTVMTYIAFRNEVDLGALPGLLPHIQWAVPRVSGRQLVVHVYDPTRLHRHHFGMLEPDPGLPEVRPCELDVVLVPGVAYDRDGTRLGFGGGYYDRFLPTTPALRVGITYGTCLAERLPCQEHDQRMDWIATPDGLLRVGATEQSSA